MPPPSDRQLKFLLSELDHNLIYTEIQDSLFKALKPSSKPVAYFLAAQPGSGKTILRNHILTSNGMLNTTAVINTDELREFHPSYRELLADPEQFILAPYLVDPDSVEWANALKAEAIERKRNLLFDVTLGGNVEHYVASMLELKKCGYEIHIAVLAVKPALSRMGIHLRYEQQVKKEGSGRFVSMDVHDRNYNNLSNNLQKILSEVDPEGVAVYTRQTFEQGAASSSIIAVIETTKETNGTCAAYKDVELCIREERERSWTTEEKSYLKQKIAEVERLITSRECPIDNFRRDIEILSQSIA